uniref:Uncharacterized protein n=1 Tax=Sipha flava TaxID=143950 RepID=A0A2S2QN68_9HEMI
MPPKSDFQKLKEIVKKNLELKKKRGSYDTFILSRNNHNEIDENTNEKTAKLLSEIRSIVRLQKTLSTIFLLKDIDEEIDKCNIERKQLKSQLDVFEREMAADCKTDMHIARRCRSIVLTVNKQCLIQAVPPASHGSSVVKRAPYAVRDQHFSNAQRDDQLTDEILRDLFEYNPKLYGCIMFRMRLLESKVLENAVGDAINHTSAIQNRGTKTNNCNGGDKTDPWKKNLERKNEEKPVQNSFRKHLVSYGDRKSTGKFKSYVVASKSWNF